MTTQEIAAELKAPSKAPPEVIKRAVKPLIPIYTFGRGKTISPYIDVKNRTPDSGKFTPGVEVGLKITF